MTQPDSRRLVTRAYLNEREIRWNSVTRTWAARNPNAEWGVVFNSANDPTASAPTDINIRVGDEWVKHPNAL